jgi:hypothetical protein
MAVDDQVKVLEGEFKLIKSEMRQTLVSVREFLLDLKLPPMQEEINLPPAQIEQPLSNNQDRGSSPLPVNNGSNGTGNSQDPQGQVEHPNLGTETNNPNEQTSKEAEINEILESDIEDNGMTSGEMPSDESPDFKPECTGDLSGIIKSESIPEIVSPGSQINLLANLIRWVSTAKREIGSEQLPIFLDVYALGGSLSREIKEVILHLAEVTADSTLNKHEGDNTRVINAQISLCMEINSLSASLPDELRQGVRRLTEILIEQTVQRNKADIWSELLLKLHGILSGNTSSLHSLVTRKKNEEQSLLEQAENMQEESSSEIDSSSVEKTEELVDEKKSIKPAKLRLVLPGNDGNEQELDLGNLFIASDQDDNKRKSRSKLSKK